MRLRAGLRSAMSGAISLPRAAHSNKLPITSYFPIPPVGIEPTTFGLKVRCSAS
jgi:hypothetical protein